MKVYGVVFYFLCVVIVGNCEEGHHIEPRILDNQTNPEINKTIPSKSTDVQAPSSNNSQASIPSSDPSYTLEQNINAVASSAPSNPVKSNETVQSVASPALNVSEDFNKVSAARFNTSSLLRSNGSASSEVINPVEIIGVAPNASSIDKQVPKIFPDGKSLNGTKIIDGDLEKLQNLTLKKNCTTEKIPDVNKINLGNRTDLEARDMLNKTIRDHADASCFQYQHTHPMEPQEEQQITDKINDDTELIENGENTEDELRKHGKSDTGTPKNPEDLSDFQQRYLAAILVSSLVAISVLCYAALLIWRRYLENRYGSRTMLVNEEEFDDPNDMRHFSI